MNLSCFDGHGPIRQHHVSAPRPSFDAPVHGTIITLPAYHPEFVATVDAAHFVWIRAHEGRLYYLNSYNTNSGDIKPLPCAAEDLYNWDDFEPLSKSWDGYWLLQDNQALLHAPPTFEQAMQALLGT